MSVCKLSSLLGYDEVLIIVGMYAFRHPDERRVLARSIGGAKRYTPQLGATVKQSEHADVRMEALDSSSCMRVDGLPQLFLFSRSRPGAR